MLIDARNARAEGIAKYRVEVEGNGQGRGRRREMTGMLHDTDR